MKEKTKFVWTYFHAFTARFFTAWIYLPVRLSLLTLNSNLKLKNKCKYYLKNNFIALQDNYIDLEEHVHETHKYATHIINEPLIIAYKALIETPCASL